MIGYSGSFIEEFALGAIGMFQAQRVNRRVMEPIDESYEAVNHEDNGEGLAPMDRVPDLAERQETLKLANEALVRARMLLEHVNRLERPGVKESGD